MIFVCLEVECIIYGAQSLKQKRSAVKSIVDRARQHFNVSIAETDHQDVWQRTKLVAVTVTNEYKHGEQVMQQLLKMIDQRHEMERTITDVYRL